MWLYFNKKGKLLVQLEHGQIIRQHDVGDEIYAYFEGVDLSLYVPTVSIKSKTLDDEYVLEEAVVVSKEEVFEMLEDENAGSIYPFVNGKTYSVVYCKINDADIFRNYGPHTMTIRLVAKDRGLGTNNILEAQGSGMVSFNVEQTNETTDSTILRSEKDDLISQVGTALDEYLEDNDRIAEHLDIVQLHVNQEIPSNKDFTGIVTVQEPTTSSNPTTKNYVDSNFVTKKEGNNIVYGKFGGEESSYTIDYLRTGRIPFRNDNGTFEVGNPTEAYHVTHKDYVDTKVTTAKNEVITVAEEIASGKCETYVISYANTAERIKSYVSTVGLKIYLDDNEVTQDVVNGNYDNSIINGDFNSQDSDMLTIGAPSKYIFVRESSEKGVLVRLSDLKKGDIILVIQVEVPDRWCNPSGTDGMNFYKLEIGKVNLDDYVDKSSNETISGVKNFGNGITIGDDIALQRSGTFNSLHIGNNKNLSLNGFIFPQYTDAKDIGSSTHRWNNLYLGGYTYFKSSGSAVDWKLQCEDDNNFRLLRAGEERLLFSNTDITATSNFLPKANDTYNLGKAEQRWNNLYLGGVISNGTKEIAVENIVSNQNKVVLSVVYDDDSDDVLELYGE